MPLLKIRSISLLSFFLCISVLIQTNNPLFAQIKVKGTLLESEGNKPIVYGTAYLKNQQTLKEYSLNTDSIGNFTFQSVPAGDYIFKAFYVGFPQLQKNINIPSSESVYNMGRVMMQAAKNVIKEVKVVGIEDLVIQRPDGIEYMADKDPTNIGASASELFQKIPMVTVDMDDNLELRGNGNVKVLIDGKPSSIVASSVSDVLKQLPADNIKSVRVITSPGAKYDAEGSAGVIDIITKKSDIRGINGRVFSGLNYNLVDGRFRGMGGLSLNYKKNKLSLSANLGLGRWSFTSLSEAERIAKSGNGTNGGLRDSFYTEGGGNFIWTRLSADYTIDSQNSVSVGAGIRPGTWKNDKYRRTIFPSQSIDYIQTSDQKTPRMNYSFNAGYNHKFKKPEQTLDLLALYSMNNQNAGYMLDQNDMPGDVLTYEEESENATKNNEFTLQADYVHPLKKYHQKIETGLKYINRDVSSDYNLQYRNNTSGSDWILSPNRTNRLDYIQQVISVYGQFTTDLAPKLSLIGGLRYEFTDIAGELRDNGGKFGRPFNNLLPSAILSYKINRFDMLNLSYTQRIERPSINFINPYIDSSDPLNVTEGNPDLAPEQIHKVELAYNTMLGKNSINAALFYSHTQNGIEAFTEVANNGVATTYYGNYAVNNTTGMNLFGSTSLFKRWRINLNGNLYWKQLQGSGVENSGWQYDARFNTDVDLYKGLSASAFAMYRGRNILLQGTKSGWYRYNIGLKQKVLKGKGDITLTAENFLFANNKSIADFDYGDVLYRTVSYRRARSIRLGFSYSFGQMKVNPKKMQQTKEIQNQDLKGGGGQDGDQQDDNSGGGTSGR